MLLSSIESRLGVVISNSIGVGVGRRLIRVSWLSMVGGSSMDNRGMVSGSSVDNRGMISWSSMDNTGSMVSWGVDNGGVVSRGGMENRGMVSWGSMNNRGMVDRGMIGRGSMISSNSSMSNSNRSVSTVCWLNLMQTLGVVYLRDGGMGSSKSLGLNNASLFSIRSGH